MTSMLFTARNYSTFPECGFCLRSTITTFHDVRRPYGTVMVSPVSRTNLTGAWETRHLPPAHSRRSYREPSLPVQAIASAPPDARPRPYRPSPHFDAILQQQAAFLGNKGGKLRYNGSNSKRRQAPKNFRRTWSDPLIHSCLIFMVADDPYHTTP